MACLAFGKHDGGMTHPVATGVLRVSHAEREPAVDRLQQAYAEGRLDKPEFDVRLHLAMTAKTRDDLDAVLADLEPMRDTARQPTRGPEGQLTHRPPEEDPTAGQRVLAALAHVLGIVTLFVGPLVMLCTRAKRSSYVRAHIVAALNFQLTLLIVSVVTFGVGAIAYGFAWIVAGVAGLLALSGSRFRYPFTLRLVR
jgi:uncharacterized Tic20 family protein